MIHDDTKVSEWGISQDSKEDVDNENCVHHLKDETTVPEDSIPVTQGFEDNIVGEARNFRKTEEGVLCDIEISDNYFNRVIDDGYDLTVAPKFEGETSEDEEIEGIRFEDSELQEVSVIFSHANPDLNDNFKAEDAYEEDQDE